MARPRNVVVVQSDGPAPLSAGSRTAVSDDFVRHARPPVGHDGPSISLVKGLQKLSRLEPIFADRNLAEYVPHPARR